MREYRVECIHDIPEEVEKFINDSNKEGWKTQSIQVSHPKEYNVSHLEQTVIILQFKDD